MTVKVSVLVPIYNVERYLPQCLDSLVDQSYKNLEIICINDGSTDHSLDIIQQYAGRDSRIKVISKTNTGYGESMNMGLDLATGKYIAILESDDFAKTSMIQELCDIAEKYDVEVVKASCIRYWEDHQVFEDFYAKRNMKPEYFNQPIEPTDIVLDMLWNSVPIWSALYRRDFLNEKQIRFLTTPGGSYQDTLFAVKTLMNCSHLFVLPKAYVYYRQDSVNSCMNSKLGDEKVSLLKQEMDQIQSYLNDHLALQRQYQIVFDAYRIKNYFFVLTKTFYDRKYLEVFAERLRDVDILKYKKYFSLKGVIGIIALKYRLFSLFNIYVKL